MAQQPPGNYPPSGPPPPPAYPQGGGYQQGGYPPTGTRPAGVTAAAVILIILGSLAALFGIIAMIGGGAVAGTFGGLGGIILVIGLLVIVWGVFEIISGVKILGLSNGWRIAGIVLSAIGAVFSLIGLIGAFSGGQELDPQTFELTAGGPNIAGIVTNLIGLALYVAVIVLLARNSRAFTR